MIVLTAAGGKLEVGTDALLVFHPLNGLTSLI
jgi:hypothetical protein